MADRSYIDTKHEAISAENQQREAARQLTYICVDIIKSYASITDTPAFDERYYELPTVKWNEDGSALFALSLKNEDGEPIIEDELTNINESIRYTHPSQVSVLYYPPNEDDITVATIRLCGGPDNTAVVINYEGQRLSTDEVEALRNDLQRYQQLIEQGRFKDPPNARSKL